MYETDNSRDPIATRTNEEHFLTAVQQAGDGVTAQADTKGRVNVTLRRRAPNNSREVLSVAYDAGYVPTDVWCLHRDIRQETIQIGFVPVSDDESDDMPVYRAANRIERETSQGPVYAYQNRDDTLSVQAPIRNTETDIIDIVHRTGLRFTSFVTTDDVMELRFE